MSRFEQSMEIRAGVIFESRWNLKISAGVISDQLFAGIPFSDEIPGLREEVPAVALTKEVFGLTFVLHGDCNGNGCEFTLEASPGSILFDRLGPCLKRVDIGQWLAQLIETVPEFKVIGFSPIEM